MRIYNWRQTAPSYLRAFVLFPTLLAFAIYALVTDAIPGKDGADNRAFEAVAVGVCVLVQLVATIYAVSYPVVWFELGATLRYRTLWRQYEHEWSDVKRIWFEDGTEATKAAFFWFVAEPHQVLNIKIDDFTEMSILIPQRQMPALHSLMSAHPAFRTTPDHPDPEELPEHEPDYSDSDVGEDADQIE